MISGTSQRTLSTGIDAIVVPSYTFASQPAAVAGYPNIAIPVGLTSDGKPAAMWMYSRFLEEPKLLAFAYVITSKCLYHLVF